jgi:hypothetical protein
MRKSREESHIKRDLPACLSSEGGGEMAVHFPPEGEGKYLYINKGGQAAGLRRRIL